MEGENEERRGAGKQEELGRQTIVLFDRRNLEDGAVVEVEIHRGL